LLAGRESLLTAIFDRVIILPAVQRELLRAHTALPEWIEVLSPVGIPASVSNAGRDPGETEAIALALELHPDTMLMDERLGRRLARQHGLQVTGLLGLIVLAKQRNLIAAVAPVIRELQRQGSCWFSSQLLREVCEAAGETWE
jgi:uncharacterized protein